MYVCNIYVCTYTSAYNVCVGGYNNTLALEIVLLIRTYIYTFYIIDICIVRFETIY